MERPAPVLALTIVGDPRSQGSKSTGVAANGRRWHYEHGAHQLKTWRELVAGAFYAWRQAHDMRSLSAAVVGAEFVFTRPKGHFVTRRGDLTGTLKAGYASSYYARGLRDVDKMQRALGDAIAASGLIPGDQRVFQWTGSPDDPLAGPAKVWGAFTGARIWVWDAAEVEAWRAARAALGGWAPGGPPGTESLKEGPAKTHARVLTARGWEDPHWAVPEASGVP